MPKVIAGITTYTREEVAAMLGVSARTVSDYIKTGKIRAVKLAGSYLISEKNLTAFLNCEAPADD